MAVPDFQSWFLPLLRRLSDGKDHGMSELYQALADDTALSAEDRAQLLKSGAQLVFENRIGWARTYLKKAGLIEAPSRGVVRITERGKSILVKPPEKLNVKFLRHNLPRKKNWQALEEWRHGAIFMNSSTHTQGFDSHEPAPCMDSQSRMNPLCRSLHVSSRTTPSRPSSS